MNLHAKNNFNAVSKNLDEYTDQKIILYQIIKIIMYDI